MSTKTVALIVALVGLVIALFFALADVLGYGGSPDRFGAQQIIGTVAGLILFGIGLAVYYQQRQHQEN